MQSQDVLQRHPWIAAREGGEDGQGILKEGDICDFQGLLSKPIVVFGKAVYRPSGRLLRIDADKIEAGSTRISSSARFRPAFPPSSGPLGKPRS